MILGINKRVLLYVVSLALLAQTNCARNKTIKIGIIHSLTGYMAVSELPMIDAYLMAIDEINSTGGITGKKIVPIIRDGKSDPEVFAREAEDLIKNEHVSFLFGCWTSACRKKVKPIVEKYNVYLFYPVQYEGLESSPNIIYTGAAPNQQIIPATNWLMEQGKKRFYIIGSNYIFPYVASIIMKDLIDLRGNKVVGERYIEFGKQNFSDVIKEIKKAKPDIIINTINGIDNKYFFQSLRKANITPKVIPVMSFSITDVEMNAFNIGHSEGDYAAWNYFSSIQSPMNKAFIKKFKDKYGKDKVGDPMVSAYISVYLWAQATRDTYYNSVEMVKGDLDFQNITAPDGTIVSVDHITLHLWKTIYIGRTDGMGGFEIVWQSTKPIRPEPFPVYRSPIEWLELLNKSKLINNGKNREDPED